MRLLSRQTKKMVQIHQTPFPHRWWGLGTSLGPVETRKLSFRLYVITYRLFALAKTDTKNRNACIRMQTDNDRFAFCFFVFFFFLVHWVGVRRVTYLYLDSTKNVDKNWTTYLNISRTPNSSRLEYIRATPGTQ